jgi:hypothetical protein
MIHKHITSENYSILKKPNTCVYAEDYLDMNEDEYKRMSLFAINGEQVLYMLDALEFYAKHYKKIVPPRVAKAMKEQSDQMHIEIVDAWKKGVRLDADTFDPLEFDISELLDNPED